MKSRRARRLIALAMMIAALEAVCRMGLVRPTDLVPPTTMVLAMAAAFGESATLHGL